jgi:hypothetical protein
MLTAWQGSHALVFAAASAYIRASLRTRERRGGLKAAVSSIRSGLRLGFSRGGKPEKERTYGAA